jgi:DNA-binding beta-propeller fold protein YncE
MLNRLAVLFSLIILVTAGCASSQWALREEKSAIALQWPYQPNKAKVTYVKAVSGFTPSNGSQSLLRAVVYGKDGDGEGGFKLPVAVAIGKDGRIAVADMGCRCVYLYIPSEQRYIQLSKGDADVLGAPVSVIFDDNLNLYVSDSAAAKVFVFDRAGTLLTSLPKAGADRLKRPTGLAYNSHDKLLYVVDTLESKIWAFNAEGDVVFSFGERGERNGSFNFPTHVSWSPSDTIYVTDAMNFRIQIFNGRGGFIRSFGYHGDGSGNFAMPKGVTADKDGIIYVVDSLFDNVQLFDRNGNFLLTVGKRGSDFAEFWLPSGIFLDENGILYICDTYNGRIQLFRITENYEGGK